MNRFAVVVPYFGEFKPSAALFLNSCNRNPEIDWYIYTDCKVPENVVLGENIRWIETTLQDVHHLAETKLNRLVCLDRVYKLCDLKAFYGIIFQDDLAGYAYWGFGDVDVVYGRIVPYLERINYYAYDKINWMGHLCFVRNTPQCTQAVLHSVPGTIEAGEVLRREDNVGYDERDYNLKCRACGMKIYTGKWAADIDIYYWRMRCVDLKTFHYLLNTKDIRYAPKNYARQMFALIDGRVYRVYVRHHAVHFEEFAYIHFRREVTIRLGNLNEDTFIFSRDGFLPLEGGKKALEDVQTALKLIEQYNNQENALQELHCFLHYYFRRFKKKKA